mmetsp:Transcript_27705/g.41827  ORF Transcript_27705/g.41827 Transcript_27705/m.41827 type:complete len:140 (-) Transcript_27705:541-960(-)
MAFEDHCAWVRSLRESYDSLYDSRAGDSVRVNNADAERSGRLSVGSMRGDAGMDLAGEFDRVVDLDEYDEPVYRGGTLNFSPDLELEVGHEPPVYRSFGDLDFEEELAPVAMEPDSLDRGWLATMPPLIHRQAGRMFDD